jgi:hypothetical protein
MSFFKNPSIVIVIENGVKGIDDLEMSSPFPNLGTWGYFLPCHAKISRK